MGIHLRGILLFYPLNLYTLKTVFLIMRIIVSPFYLFILFGASAILGWIAVIMGVFMIVMTFCGRDECGDSITTGNEFLHALVSAVCVIVSPIILPFAEVYMFITDQDSILP